MKKLVVGLFIFSLFFLSPSRVYADISLIAPDSADAGKSITVKISMDSTTWQNNDPELRVVNAEGKEIICYPLGSTTERSVQTPLTGKYMSLQIVEGGKLKNDLKAGCTHPATVKILQEKKITLGNEITTAPACIIVRDKGSSQGDIVNVSVSNWDCNVNSYLTFLGPAHINDTTLSSIGVAQTKPGECTNGTIAHSFLFSLVTDRSSGSDLAVVRGNYTVNVRKNSYTDSIVASCTYSNLSDDPPMIQSLITSTPLPQDVPPPCKVRDSSGKCSEFYISGIGPVGTSPTDFIQKIFTILLSLSGGVMLLILFYSGYRIMTSQGNKEALQDARERITSAVVGLLFLIFSFVILQIIGVDLLHVFKP